MGEAKRRKKADPTWGKPQRRRIKLESMVGLWYFANGLPMYPCSAMCAWPDFSLNEFTEIINEISPNHTGWAYADHQAQRGGALPDNWDETCDLLIEKGLAGQWY